MVEAGDALDGKPGAKSMVIVTGLILPSRGCSTGGVIRLASGTRAVSSAQPPPLFGRSATRLTASPGM
jgi:hypothetical protein